METAGSSILFIITAGGTREPIDDVRYIGNISTGLLGARIAEEAHARGHEVFLLHSRASLLPRCADEIRSEAFTTSAELKERLKPRVEEAAPPTVVVHAAAVADFIPERAEGKISSGREELLLRLRRAEKIVDLIKTWNPAIHLVKFKLESHRTKEELLRIGMESRKRSKADWVVANDIRTVLGEEHSALIIDRDGRFTEARGKERIASMLLDEVERILGYPGQREGS